MPVPVGRHVSVARFRSELVLLVQYTGLEGVLPCPIAGATRGFSRKTGGRFRQATSKASRQRRRMGMGMGMGTPLELALRVACRRRRRPTCDYLSPNYLKLRLCYDTVISLNYHNSLYFL